MTEQEIRASVQKVREALEKDPSLSLSPAAYLPLFEAFLVAQAQLTTLLHNLLIHVRQQH